MNIEDIQKSSYYPHGGPSKYSYTSSFGDDNNRGKTAAQAKMNTNYAAIATKAGNKFKILFNLKLLINGARDAELKFLAATGIDVTSASAKDIFLNINTILNSQDLLKRNLDMFEQLSRGVNNELIDPSKFFFSYLQEAFEKTDIAKNFNIRKPTGKQLEQFGNEVIGYALEQTYTRFKELIDENGNIRYYKGATDSIGPNERERSSQMGEMIKAIQKLRELGAFGKYTSLLNIDTLLKESQNKRTGKIIRKPKISKNSFNSGGTPLEVINAEVAAAFASLHTTIKSGDFTLEVSSAQTGSSSFNQQKGDVMLGYSKHSIDFSEMEKIFQNHKSDDSSVRSQNVDALREYLQTVGKEIEHLLVISDKNYTIDANWSGFSAQEKMTLANAGPMLERFGVPQVTELIDYLANCGSEMIQGEVNGQVRIALASYIAYFLFDHVEIQGTVSVATNVVNIINLNNTYIPLSVYLEGVYESLERNLNDLQNEEDGLVQVNLNMAGAGAKPSSEWTVGVWREYRSYQEKNSTIAYKVMKDISSYITNLML